MLQNYADDLRVRTRAANPLSATSAFGLRKRLVNEKHNLGERRGTALCFA